MNRNKTKRSFFTACLIAILLPLGPATKSYHIESATFEVVGTSTLHDWTMASNKATSTVMIKNEASRINSIDKLNLKLKSESLKSGKSKMDEIAYEAMKSDEHPWIIFEMTEVQSIEQNGELSKIVTTGNLSIAGKTKKIKLSGLAKVGDQITISGSKDIKMTDYDIEPPTAMFGTIKTGNDLTINYSITLKPIK